MSIFSLPPEVRERIEQQRNKPRPRWIRILGRIWLGFTIVTAVILLAAVILLHSDRFHAYLIRTIEAQASESLGVRVQLQNFNLNLHALSVDLYGITVDGANPYPTPALIQVDHVAASVRIVSIIHQAWYLDNLQVDRPIAHLIFDDKGNSNIPTIKSSGSQSNTSIFDLGVRHAHLNRGEVYYNNRPSQLAADVRNLEFLSRFTPDSKLYTGSVKYSDGHLLYGTFAPITHDFEAKFDAAPSVAHLSESKLTIGESNAAIIATVQNYSNPSVSGHYDVTVDGHQVATILHNDSIPAGTFGTSGTIAYQQVPNQPVLNALVVNGTLSTGPFNIKNPAMNTSVSKIDGRYSLSNGNLLVSNLHADLLGGELTADGSLKDISGNSKGSVSASLRNISLADLAHSTGNSSAKLGVGVSGKLNAQTRATWGKSFDDLVAHADATIDGAVSGINTPVKRITVSVAQLKSARLTTSAPATGNASNVPLTAAIHATYTARNRNLAIDKSYLKTAQTDLTMDGLVSNHSALNLQLNARDLHEVDTIANVFHPPAPGQPDPLRGLAGSATFKGHVRGSIQAPEVTGQFSAANLQYNGTTVRSIRTNIAASPSMARLDHAEIEPATRGKISLTASTSLSRWSFTDKSAIQVDLDSSQINIADLTKLAGQQVPVTGIFAATVHLHGTELNPVGNGNISLSGLTAYDQPIQSVKLTFAGDGQKIDSNLNVQLPSGNIQGKGTVNPAQKTYTADITASSVQIEKLQAVKAKNVDITGTLAVTARGSGTFDNPQADINLQIPTLVAQAQKITGLNLQVNVANHKAAATLATAAVNTTIRARANIDLTGDYQADASLDTQPIPLQPLIATYAPDQSGDVTGETEIHATLHGPLKKTELLEAHVNIPVFKASYGTSIQLAAAAPIRADFKNNIVTLQRSSIQGTDTDLNFEGSVPTTGNGPMSLLLQGNVNLQLAQLFDPDIKSSGQLRFNIDSHGPTDAADFGGQIDIVDANYSSPDLPVGLQHGNGVLKVTKDRINIASFNATVGGGTLTAQGGIAYRPSLQFDLGLAAQNMRVLYPTGMREGIEANLRLAGTPDNATLGGSVNLTDLSFTSAFDLNDFIGQFSGGVASPPSAGMAQNIQLNIGVRSTSNVNLVSRSLSIDGSANLQVRGTAADPVILGRVNLNSGDIILNGTRFVLNGGTIQFINPSETQPVVNLSLNTNIQQYSIDLRFQGPVDQLHTEYSSDPALPSADIINLLAFGETSEASAQNPTSTNQAAESLVASQVSSQITSRVSKIAGISQLSISPVLAGSSSQGPPGAVITVQQRVTGNLFVNFSTNVASTQSQTIQGQYKISPKVSLSATRDPNGGFAVDTLIKKTW